MQRVIYGLDLELDAGPGPESQSTAGPKFVYQSGVEMFHGGPDGCTFEGTAGKLYVNRPVLQSDPADILQEPLAEDAPRIYRATHHRRNWIECIRSREAPICPAEVGHRSATICHLANIAYRLRRPLDWDPRREEILNDEEANTLLSREPRKPWSYT